MKKKVFLSIFLMQILILSSFVGSIQGITQSDSIEKNEKEQSSLEKIFLSDITKEKNNNFLDTQISFLSGNKDQYCENGDKNKQIFILSDQLAQSFKPQLHWFTKLKIYLGRSSEASSGILLVLIRNNSITGNNWLGAYIPISLLPTSGNWIELECDKPYLMTPDNTYCIVLKLLVPPNIDEYSYWRYNTDNPYSRGKAYLKEGGSGWQSKNDWDFNFQTWGVSTNPPGIPNSPTPNSGETNQNLDVQLGWSCSEPDGDALTYDVYFGTSTPPPLVSLNQPDISYEPDFLNYETEYYWKIIARDCYGVERNGPVWNFKTEDAPPGPPEISFVETYFADGSEASYGFGFLLQGLNLKNTYTAHIAHTNVDKVEFVFDFISPQYATIVDIDGSDGWTATIDTQYVLNPFGSYKVRAHNSHGWGDYKTYEPRIVPMAGWLANYLVYISENNGTKYVTFSIGEKDDPPKPKNNYWTFEAAVNFSTGSPEDDESPVDVDVDVPVDDVGGNYGYSGGIGSSIVFSSDGVIDVSGELQASVEAKSVSGSIGASLHGSIAIQNNEIEWQEMYITINGEVTIPVFVIPLEICGIGVKAGIDITPYVEITFQLEPDDSGSGGLVPGLGIDIKEDSGISGNVGAKVRAYAELGIAIADFYAEAGGSATIYFKTPPTDDYGYLDRFELACWIGGKIRFLFWTAEGWYRYVWNYPSGRLQQKSYDQSPWSILDRDYVNPDSGSYNQIVNWNDDQEIGEVIRNVFPHANPSVVYNPESSGIEVMMVWAHDNNNKAKVQGMELFYTNWEKWGEGMATPQVIPATRDNKLQMDPHIAFDKNGNVVCVFVQTDDSIDEQSGYLDAAISSELAYCIWDKDSETWGDIYQITDNERVDISPVLGYNDNGDVILVWTSDADADTDDSEVTTLNDRSIFAAFWDGTSWSDEISVAENKCIVSTPKVAIDSNNNLGDEVPTATCVFSMDSDGDATTSDDQDLYYTTINNGNKRGNEIIRFTNDDYQDVTPSVVYGNDGNSYIVWLKNKHYTDSDSGEEIYDGVLYYQQIGGNNFGPTAIVSDTISNPVAIQSSAAGKLSDTNFMVGWNSGKDNYKLNWADIKLTRSIDKGTMYGSDMKLSETDWCYAAGGMNAITIERPSIEENNKNCKLSFIHNTGFDNLKPETECSLDGDIKGYGIYGPEFQYPEEVKIDFEAVDDQGGSGVYKTEYRLDNGAWEIYNSETEIMVKNIGRHTVLYRSVDRAGNTEETKTMSFRIFTTHKPTRPIKPMGPTSGKEDETLSFSTRAFDEDEGDILQYKWSWDDSTSGWSKFYAPGQTVIEQHEWDKKGSYEVKVIARDQWGAVSSWSETLEVNIDDDKSKHKSLFLNFIYKFKQNSLILLEKIINTYPFIKGIM